MSESLTNNVVNLEQLGPDIYQLQIKILDFVVSLFFEKVHE